MVSVNPYRSDKENRRLRMGSALSTISSPRNTARARRMARFESGAARMTVSGSHITGYPVPCNPSNAGGRHSPRRAPLNTKPASTWWAEMALKRRKPRSGAYFAMDPEHSFRPPKGLRWKRTASSFNRRSSYQKWHGIPAPAPIARTSIVIDAEREGSEFRWLAVNQRQYAGRWVALDGNTLLAIGNSAREVYAAIAGHKRTPLVTYVEKENEPYFAGW